MQSMHFKQATQILQIVPLRQPRKYLLYKAPPDSSFPT